MRSNNDARPKKAPARLQAFIPKLAAQFLAIPTSISADASPRRLQIKPISSGQLAWRLFQG